MVFEHRGLKNGPNATPNQIKHRRKQFQMGRGGAS